MDARIEGRGVKKTLEQLRKIRKLQEHAARISMWDATDEVQRQRAALEHAEHELESSNTGAETTEDWRKHHHQTPIIAARIDASRQALQSAKTALNRYQNEVEERSRDARATELLIEAKSARERMQARRDEQRGYDEQTALRWSRRDKD